MAAICDLSDSTTAGTGDLRIFSDATNYYPTRSRQGFWSNIRSQPSSTRGKTRTVVIRADPPYLPSYWPIDEGVGRSQQSAPVRRLPVRRARQSVWTGRNFRCSK